MRGMSRDPRADSLVALAAVAFAAGAVHEQIRQRRDDDAA